MKRVNNHNGFSLLEVMVSVAIFAVGILALFSTVEISAVSNAIGDGTTEAMSFAQSRVSFLQGLAFNDSLLNSGSMGAGTDFTFGTINLQSDTLSPVPDHTLTPPETGMESNRNYEVYWNVRNEDIDGDNIFDVKRIAVLVRWREAGGRFRSIIVGTAKCNPALLPSNLTNKVLMCDQW